MRTRISDGKLMETLEELGTFYWLNPDAEEKDYRFALNLHDSHTEYNGYNDFRVNDDASFTVGGIWGVLDINVLDDPSYQYEVGLCSHSFAVAELGDVLKIISIVYGSDFSLELERINVGWVRYEIKISMLKSFDEYGLEKNIRTLRHLFVQVVNNVKLQGDYES